VEGETTYCAYEKQRLKFVKVLFSNWCTRELL